MIGQSDLQGPSLTRGRILARNTLLSIVGQTVPLLIAVFTMPFLIRGLGTERFGILAMAWMVIGYFTFFDLGLSRATIRYFALALGQGSHQELPGLFWTSLALNGALGLIAGACLVLLTPLFADRVFSIPAGLAGQARTAFYVLSASLPVILVSTVLRGVLEAAQRFDLINIVQTTAGSLSYVLPLVGLSLGFDLAGIVTLLVGARLVFAVVFFAFCFTVFPALRQTVRIDRTLIKPLFSFGGWMTVSNVAGPALLFLDRVMIGSLISVAAVAYYTAPYEILIRLMVFPGSVITVLFPAFSAIGTASRDVIARLYARSIKYLLVVMVPVLLVMILFAGDILRLWLGAEYAARSAAALQILALGMMLTPVQVSLGLIQGAGRPDIPARFYLAELLVYIPLVAYMAKSYGIEGVAAAWTMRAALDTVLLVMASAKLCGLDWRTVTEHGLARCFAAIAMLGVISAVMLAARLPVAARAAAASVCFVGFSAVSWRYVMDAKDRELLSFGRLR